MQINGAADGKTLISDSGGQLVLSDMITGSLQTGATAGSVLFAGSTGAIAQDNANLFYDNTNDRLGLGTTAPGARLHVSGAANSVKTIVQGGVAQTANMSEWKDSSSTILSAIKSDGGFFVKDATNPVTGRYLVYAEAAFNRKFGFFLVDGGNEITLKADSQMKIESAGTLNIKGGNISANAMSFNQNSAGDPAMVSLSGRLEIGYDRSHSIFLGSAIRTKAAGVITLELVGFGGGTGITYTNSLISMRDTQNGYAQCNIQNCSTGAIASTDYIATSNTGTDSTLYVDMGINGNGFSDATWTINGANDGYYYATENLAIGTTGAKELKLFTGGSLAANARVTISATGKVTFGTVASVDTLGEATFTGMKLAIRTVTTAPTILANDHTLLCDATAAGFSVVLPAAATNSGRILNVKKIDATTNVVTIDGNASETIDGALTYAINEQYRSIQLQCNGSNWYVV